MIVIRQQLLQTASGNLCALKRVLVSERGLGKPQQTGFCLSWKNFGESQGKLEATGGNDPNPSSLEAVAFPASLYVF